MGQRLKTVSLIELMRVSGHRLDLPHRVRLGRYLLLHPLWLDGRRMRYVLAQRMAQRPGVVGVHLHIELRPRHRDISHAAIEKLAVRLLRVHMDKHTVGGLALAAVARHRVTIVQMRMLLDVELDLAA